MQACWSVKGGVGVTVVAAGLAAARLARPSVTEVLLVDLGGDLPALFGVAEPAGPGLGEWSEAGADAPPDALGRLKVPLGPGLQVVPRGVGALHVDRAPVLHRLLQADPRPVVVDVGDITADPFGGLLAAAADRSLLVTRACPLAQRRVEGSPVRPTGVVLVRDHRRALTWQSVSAACAAPVLVELDVDPAVGAAVDAGLANRPLPRSYLRALQALS